MRVSVIVEDRTVVVDGVALIVEVPPESVGIHAIQWDSDSARGSIERTDGHGHVLTDDKIVAPYVAAWRAARNIKLAVDAEAAKAAAAETDREAEKVAAAAERRRQAAKHLAKSSAEAEKAAQEAKDRAAAQIEQHRQAEIDRQAEIMDQMKQAEALGRREMKTMEKRRKAEAKAAKMREPLQDALNTLASTDHKVLKALEEKLAEEGRLPAELVQKRAEARKVAKATKKKLGLE